MVQFNKRIETVIEKRVGSFRGAKSLFAKSIGCDNRILGQWIKGTQEPSDVYLEAIVRNHNIRYEWLTKGEGDMEHSS